MGSAFVAALLASTAAALAMLIDYTYGPGFRTVIPDKMQRMHTRALFYVLLVCTGVLCVILAYVEARARLAEIRETEI